MRKQKMRRKPISFDTTVRNPRRIPQFISVLQMYEGKILNEQTIIDIMVDLIKRKLIAPTKGTLGTYTKSYTKKF
ncbi:hypothetical protein [Staphylococcus sp. GDX8P80P]|uniref:hypothetical protein n=1 Tax=Staphylococcus sp. GDX8P80P TaxID=2804104 RepID=UPI001AEC69A4|nr:hypothetical protein [Staphylococcus sp. GDX8P80P]